MEDEEGREQRSCRAAAVGGSWGFFLLENCYLYVYVRVRVLSGFSGLCPKSKRGLLIYFYLCLIKRVLSIFLTARYPNTN
jgi:hypothetical protein